MLDKFTVAFTNYISYDITRVSEIFNAKNQILADHIKTKRAFFLIDNSLLHYVEELRNYLFVNEIDSHLYYISPTEQKKDLESVLHFTDYCFEHKISRKDTIVAFGGGITCDLAGLAANLIRRGTPCIKIPTTLLGVIDASIGVKTGVNYANIKNSLGTYYPPDAVLVDISLLKDLPAKEIKNGLVEMVKIIALKDLKTWNVFKENLCSFFTNSLNAEVRYLIDQSIFLMIEELSPNLLEKNLHRIVDYGHEFGHIIEILTNYKLSHGEAVGIGMLLSNLIAYDKGIMNGDDFYDFLDIYQKLNIPLWHPALSAKNLFDEVSTISRHKGGEFSIVALEKIGKPIFMNSISFAEIIKAADFLKLQDLQHADVIDRTFTASNTRIN